MALDNPAFGHHDKSGNPTGMFHDFNVEMRENFRKPVGKLRALIGAVGEQRFQEGKRPQQRRHDESAAIGILNVGRMHDGTLDTVRMTNRGEPPLRARINRARPVSGGPGPKP